ncbi:hypothetical protein G3I19_33340, partial [Streptomyces sp. SID10853]|nr:hypothetical protein [Streptomyces sp. SID10853]
PLAATLPAAELLGMAARCDSALVWALVLHRLREGDPLGQALADTVTELSAAAPGSRLNLLLTDGATIAATAWGDTLWYLTEPDTAGDASAGAATGASAGTAGRTVVASEPYDDGPGWREVPDRTLLVATRTDVQLTPLKEPTA